ncbi:MAG TPA: ATP synthase F1 subunit delta [Candidatus Limnocylindrales bacterium]|nr:ATP synthase F1 subunit delta [Candidatus Limnocylindrales bacterium]
MPISAVSVRYANALADVVTGPASPLKPQDATAELRSFVATLQGSPELHNALITPAVPSARKKAVITRITDRLGMSKITRNFLYVLIDHRRIGSVPEIVESFEQVLDRRLGIEQAEVISANELTEQQRTALQAQLARLTGKQIRMRFAIDGSLIGGVMARIGSTVYDGSVRGQLEALGRRLGSEI